ncbi:hypothetical protein V2I01_13900 [Micromonospora sp. BRA006-A]|nr:hypothetical protein [Micromonospora sp. BRA006-A]
MLGFAAGLTRLAAAPPPLRPLRNLLLRLVSTVPRPATASPPASRASNPTPLILQLWPWTGPLCACSAGRTVHDRRGGERERAG